MNPIRHWIILQTDYWGCLLLRIINLLFFLLPIGSGQNLRQTERGEFFWSKRGSETGNSHQDGCCCCRKGHRQRRKNGKQQKPRASRPNLSLVWAPEFCSAIKQTNIQLLLILEVTESCVCRWMSCRTWQQLRWWSLESRHLMKTIRSSSRLMDISTPARYVPCRVASLRSITFHVSPSANLQQTSVYFHDIVHDWPVQCRWKKNDIQYVLQIKWWNDAVCLMMFSVGLGLLTH